MHQKANGYKIAITFRMGKYLYKKKYLNYEKDNNRISIKTDSQGIS